MPIQFIKPDQQRPEAVDPSETPLVDKSLLIDLLIKIPLPASLGRLPVSGVLLNIGDHIPTLDSTPK